ncbi:MAG: dTDP-4-dehydrorhamnose reductase [Rhodospirillales bacterium]|nr:dTDP-4-dehydrorhamnose reductase [Rhodospirillales bacterium]
MTAVAVFGAGGQIGQAIHKLVPDGYQVIPVLKDMADLTVQSQVIRIVQELYQDHNCRFFINAAAYTAVDLAEDDLEQAFTVNWKGASYLAGAVATCAEACLLHLSTDYIFDGGQKRAYREEDPANPLCIYGLSKLAGELAISAQCPRHIMVRTSWVFGPDGKNFLKTMLSLAERHKELRIVNDQRGGPTYSYDIARAFWGIVHHLEQTPAFDEWGIYHYGGAESVTWYEFAHAIFEQAKEQGFSVPERLVAISSPEFPQKALRPSNSFLDTRRVRQIFAIEPCSWRDGIRRALQRLKSDSATGVLS